MSALANLTLVAWALLELSVRVREGVQGKGSRKRDRGTRVLIAITLGAAIGVAAAAASLAPSLRTPAAFRVLGVIVMWLGLATRVWAIAALGGAFRTTVEVDPGQAVVATARTGEFATRLTPACCWSSPDSAWPSATGCRSRFVSCCRCRASYGASR